MEAIRAVFADSPDAGTTCERLAEDLRVAAVARPQVRFRGLAVRTGDGSGAPSDGGRLCRLPAALPSGAIPRRGRTWLEGEVLYEASSLRAVSMASPPTGRLVKAPPTCLTCRIWRMRLPNRGSTLSKVTGGEGTRIVVGALLEHLLEMGRVPLWCCNARQCCVATARGECCWVSEARGRDRRDVVNGRSTTAPYVPGVRFPSHQGYRISRVSRRARYSVFRSLEALAMDAQAGCSILAQEIERDVAQDRQVLVAMVFADATLIFAKGHIEHPMQAVLNAPVTAHRLQDMLRSPRAGVREATDVVAHLSRAGGAHLARCPYPHYRCVDCTPRRRPASRAARVRDRPTLTDLDASVALSCPCDRRAQAPRSAGCRPR